MLVINRDQFSEQNEEELGNNFNLHINPLLPPRGA